MTQVNMDSLTDGIRAASLIVVAGLTAAALIKSGPKIARWGYGQILGWFR